MSYPSAKRFGLLRELPECSLGLHSLHHRYFGHPIPSFIQDIDGRVYISVVDSSADGTLPFSDR